MKFRPIGDRVLIKPEKNAEMSESGLLHLVEHRKPETMGTVVAVGLAEHPLKAEAESIADEIAPLISSLGLDLQDRAVDMLRRLVAREPSVKVGDDVLFSWMAGQELILEDDERYLLLRESDILAVLED